MKNKLFLLFFIFFYFISFTKLNSIGPLKTKMNAKESFIKKVQNQKCVLFNYYNEDVTNIINHLAALKCINIIFPQPPHKFNVKVTFTKYDEISLDEAWNLLTTILDIAGYSIVHKNRFYEIVKNEQTIREPLATYINASDKLPESDEKVRFVYFFDNISIAPNSAGFNNLEQILRNMLPGENEGGSFILDNQTNSVIITNRSNSIRNIMKIIQELDKSGFRESLEVVTLKNVKADFISKIISQIMPSEQEQQQQRYFGSRGSRPGASIFPENSKIIPLERTNSIAIFGPTDSINRIKDFISKHLDLPLESQRSVVHVKTLQYLSADDFAPVLQELVQAKSASAQAQGDTRTSDTLSSAIIIAEKQTQFQSIQPTSTAAQQQQNQSTTPTVSTPVYGGNRLVVAARGNDWQIINRLIDELDKPQLQVALEVLIVDLTVDNDRALGAQLRNRLDCNKPSNVNFQTAHLHEPVVNFMSTATGNVPTIFGLAANFAVPQFTEPGSEVPANISSLSEDGSTVLNFENGNGISAVLRVLENNNSNTILSQPYIVTANNQQANISVARKILVKSAVVQQATGPAIVKNDYLPAALTVNILPRISSTENINLDILVTVNDFDRATTTNAIITTRQVKTNANLKNKEILALGGLPKYTKTEVLFETPILSKIPIFGNLFKSKTVNYERTNLMIFISPTIIKPRLQGGANFYTEKKFDLMNDELIKGEMAVYGSVFEKLRDPITRVFFKPFSEQSRDVVETYKKQEIFLEPKERSELKRLPKLPIRHSAKTIEPHANHVHAEKIKKLIANDENPLKIKR